MDTGNSVSDVIGSKAEVVGNPDSPLMNFATTLLNNVTLLQALDMILKPGTPFTSLFSDSANIFGNPQNPLMNMVSNLMTAQGVNHLTFNDSHTGQQIEINKTAPAADNGGAKIGAPPSKFKM